MELVRIAGERQIQVTRDIRNKAWVYLFCLCLVGIGFYHSISKSYEQTRSLHSNEEREKDMKPKEVTKVVLATYYRGGSTFIGELFNQNPAAFYWFEPNAYPVFHLSRQMNINPDEFFVMDNGSFRNHSLSTMKYITKVLRNILDCNLIDVDRQILSHYFITKWGKAVKSLPFAECMKQYSVHSPLRAFTCLPWLEDACKSSNLRVIKTIRLPVYLAEVLIKEDPSIKLIYYHRDPRAMIISRSKFKGALDLTDTNQVENHVIRQCSLSRHDQRGFKSLSKGRSKPLVIKYEDFALNPINLAEKVYRFVSNISLPVVVRTWLKKHTNATNSNGPLGTTRKSIDTVFSWRNSMSPLVTESFSKHCMDVLDSQGYT